jgi:di/tripeptidase
VTSENAARSTRVGRVSADPQPVGDRPAGSTPADAPLVRSTAAAVAALGFKPDRNFSSTDSNIAMNLGIPAVTVGAGGDAGRSHSEDEWIDVSKPDGLRGMSVGLLALMSAAKADPQAR